jgi:hypothetical protein
MLDDRRLKPKGRSIPTAAVARGRAMAAMRAAASEIVEERILA